jgi:hypothetical protein
MFTVPPIRIGQAIRHESLSVFPLFTDTGRQPDNLLSTCSKVWQRLLSGYIMGSMDVPPTSLVIK